MWSFDQRNALLQAMKMIKKLYLDPSKSREKKADKVLAILEVKDQAVFEEDWDRLDIATVVNGFSFLEKNYHKWNTRLAGSGQGISKSDRKKYPGCRNLEGMPHLSPEQY
jgi:hypothetical protein